MKMRQLGRTGIRVSEIGLGMWAIGGDVWGKADDGESLRVVDAALDAGVNFFDTADVYGDGHSEEVLGKAMKGRRDRFVVATKIGWVGFEGARNMTAYDTPEKLTAGVERNLGRLGTDHVDIIQSHIFFREATMDAMLEGFRRLKQAGKVRAFGVSTSDPGYLRAFNGRGDCSTLQVDYSLLNRTPEADLLPYCAENGIGVIVRGALAMGLLTSRISAQTRFGQDDFRRKWTEDPAQKAVFDEDLRKVEALKPAAATRPLAEFSLRFVLDHPAVSVVIPGARTVSQLKQNVVPSGRPELTPEQRRLIDSVTPPGGGRKIWPA